MLNQAEDVQILVHSSWRECLTPGEVLDILEEVFLRTRITVLPAGEKSVVLRGWLAQQPFGTQLLVLDDEPIGLEAPGCLVVQCDACTGIQTVGVKAAIAQWLIRTTPNTLKPGL